MDELGDIGRRLALFREREGLRQSDLAEVIGVRQTTLSKYECGERKISVGKLLKICKHYGLPDNYFLSDRPIESVPPATHIDIDAETDAEMKKLYPGHFGDVYSKGASKLFRSLIKNPADVMKLLDDDYEIDFKPKAKPQPEINRTAKPIKH